MPVIIDFKNVSKLFRLGSGRGSIREAIYAFPRQLLRRNSRVSDSSEHIWALKEVSFQVANGEVLGIIGPNGAGKTTILKLLSRVTKPTSGEIQVEEFYRSTF